MKATELLIELIGEDNAMDVIQALQNKNKQAAVTRLRLYTSITIGQANAIFERVKKEWDIN